MICLCLTTWQQAVKQLSVRGCAGNHHNSACLTLVVAPAGSNKAAYGMPSSGKPPNPFQRLALIIGRLGMHCVRLGQLAGSKIMGTLIQAMRSLLRLRGR